MNLDDKFGEVMQENLYTRGICLAGTKACQNFESQVERYVIRISTVTVAKMYYVHQYPLSDSKQLAGLT